MANTVNDVMNVIASPDYGIKNIAGTTHEILAILEGTHNSENNIHSIVDDVRNLLQKLVGATTEKKPIEIGGTSTKINHKHIQDILDETKGIRKAIDNVSKILLDKKGGGNIPTVAKLSNKASEKVAEAMIKNIEKQKSGGMAALVDVFTKLKDISLKDIIFGNSKLKKITKLLENVKGNLNIKEKDLNAIIKLINTTPEMIESLSKIGWKINKVIKNDTVKKLSDILVGENSILTISKILNKNEKVFIKANSAVKNLKELTISLNKAMIKLILTSFLSRMISDKSFQAIEKMLNNLTIIAQKLSKEKNAINKGVETSKQVTILVSNLFVSSILLTASIAPALSGVIGALALKLMIETTMWSINTLSEKKKSIETSTKSAKALAVFAGQMAVTSFMLATIAVTGIPAMAGMLLMKGILWLNEKMLKTLDKSKTSITKGAIVMLLMGGSLILYGIALKKISEATKGMEWKQLGMIAALTGTFAVAIAALGIPIVAGFVALGSVTLGIMSLSLFTFAKSLKMLNDMGDVPTKTLQQSLNAMGIVKDFFVENALDRNVIKNARRYKRMLRPFGNTIKHLSKLKEMGEIPMKLVYDALNAMKAISNYYINNPIERKAIKEAKQYKRMLRPFGNTIEHLSKLKEMGVIPMKLVHGALNAMSVISNYYINNPIERNVIKQARRYKRILRPFGKTIGYFNKLKTLGEIPTRLVTKTLIAMSGIANFYKTHEINKNINVNIDNIEYAVSRFVETASKITEIKSEHNKIIVSDTIEACQHIIDYYNKNKKSANKDKAEKLNEIVKLFSENADHLKNAIKDYKPDNYYGVKLMVNSMKSITDFLKTDVLDKSERKVAEKNIEIFKNMTSAMSGLSTIDQSNISSVGSAIKSTLDDVNAVDISQVNAVTNMFNAFSSINKSQNAIDKFTKSVNEFTAACNNLMNAMGDNTDAINNMNGVDMNNSTNVNNETNYYGSGSDNTTNQTNSIRISNVEEIAKTIAERINGALSVDMPDTQVQLLINGTGGNEWIITKY